MASQNNSGTHRRSGYSTLLILKEHNKHWQILLTKVKIRYPTNGFGFGRLLGTKLHDETKLWTIVSVECFSIVRGYRYIYPTYRYVNFGPQFGCKNWHLWPFIGALSWLWLLITWLVGFGCAASYCSRALLAAATASLLRSSHRFSRLSFTILSFRTRGYKSNAFFTPRCTLPSSIFQSSGICNNKSRICHPVFINLSAK